MTPSFPTFRVCTVAAFFTLLFEASALDETPTAIAATRTTRAPIRSGVNRVTTPVTLDKEEQVRRIVLLGLVLFAATVAVAAAATGGLPHIGTPSMKAQPVHRGF